MSEFARTRAMRQFYRDAFTRLIDLPEVDVMPALLVAEIFSFKSAEFDRLEPMIAAASTGLDADKEAALKNMLRALTLANRVLDADQHSEPQALSAQECAQITEYVVAALQADSNSHYLIAAIQILFRVNEISSALFLINNNLSLISDSGTVLKILLLICLMEEDYNQAMVVIQVLTSDAELIGEDPLALLMITGGIYKLGGLPDSFIDFRALDDSRYFADDAAYTWYIEKENKQHPTVLVACDKRDYFSHVLPLAYSLYETNRGVLDMHIHLYNSDDELKESVVALRQQLPELHISATLEQVPEGKHMAIQYAARRTIFMDYALREFATPVISMNADLLVRQPWVSPEAPLQLLENENAPFWETTFAGFIYAEPGSMTRTYFARVARFIRSNLSADTPVWCMEQVALSASLDRLSGTEQMAISRAARSAVVSNADGRDVFCWPLSAANDTEEPSRQYRAALIKKYQG